MKENKNKKVAQLKSLAKLLDSQFTGPYGIKFGLDGLIGLFPIFGDMVTNTLSLYIIIQAAMLGCGPATIVRMGLNVAIENMVDVIPLFGHFFDFFWKSNNKNISILEDYILRPQRVSLVSRFIIGGIVLVIVLLLVASAIMTIYVFKLLASFLLS